VNPENIKTSKRTQTQLGMVGMSVISVLGMLRQKFKASLGYIARPCLIPCVSPTPPPPKKVERKGHMIPFRDSGKEHS
jgi:hypothetical protein